MNPTADYTLTIIVPVYNEQEGLPALEELVNRINNGQRYSFTHDDKAYFNKEGLLPTGISYTDFHEFQTLIMLFYHDLSLIQDYSMSSDSIDVLIDGPIKSKELLIRRFTENLSIPYPNENWDGLDEDLRDLSWVSQKHIRIIHTDLPHLSDKDFLEITLDMDLTVIIRLFLINLINRRDTSETYFYDNHSLEQLIRAFQT